MDLNILLLILLLILSAFFSSAELAYVVSNRIKIELRARQNKFSAKNAQYFLKNPQTFFSTILISNNIVNIAFASIITVFLTRVFELGDFSILLISSGLLLLFGEVIPKYFARELADIYIGPATILLRGFTFLLYPFVKITSSLSSLLTKTENISEEKMSYLFEKEDIHYLIHESKEAGFVAEEESDIVNKIIELSEQRVYEVLTPRTDIVGVEINSTIDELRDIFIQSGYSKLPVFEENIDNVKGLVFAYDLFKDPTDINSIMKEVIFVPDTKKCLEMLNEFLEQGISIAIAVDEFGGTAGVVTVEDIIEELFGEIRDEYDVEEDVCKKVDELTYVISGKVEIDFINEEYEIDIPQGDYETIGGYITSNLGRIPKQGETISLDHFKILILRSDTTKISLIKLFVDRERFEEINQ